MYKLFIFISLSVVCACNKKQPLFSLIASDDSGITFSNTLNENDSLNILDVENIYNGGGVGIGDFNNDGLHDIYFTANTVSNKLYLNKGNFKFEDITNNAGVTGEGRWSRGVSIVDINNDGLQDIYVCATLSTDVRKRENLLYINTGIDAQGQPHFENKASEYGLADTSHSTMAAFFDYDNDGDLDMYLLINEIIKGEFPSAFRPLYVSGEHASTDKLFKNDWNDSLKHPLFTDVSVEAGIKIEGYGHGVNVVDINNDGWKDVYVTNDFISPNLLYINNHDGTFKNEATTYFKHTSESSMGQDVIDINNDGLVDVIEADMNPEDNYRKKMMMNALSYQRYQNNETYGYQYQYVRNVLQINQGPRMENDSLGPPVFTDIAFHSGIAETDWSWTPSVADFDNDGYRDIIITNGFPKDVTDHDFGSFRSKAYNIASKKEILEQIPQVKIPNYAYKNNGDITFKDVTKEWGMDMATFSNGAAYADLDNDGDMDYVVNNINDKALLYKNNSRGMDATNNYLQIKLVGDSLNKNGLGAFVELHFNGNLQVYENTPFRGYLSSISPIVHFGLGTVQSVDSVIIKWPDGKMQLIQNAKTNQLITADKSRATNPFSFEKPFSGHPLFSDATSKVKINYAHKERDYIDFNVQKLLPHKLSEYGPGLAVGDIDGNGLDDIVSGGSFFYDAQIFLQQQNGNFSRKTLLNKGDSIPEKTNEDLGVLLFDADNDNDLDIYFASGGYELEHNTPAYNDRLYINNGKGNFQRDSLALPKNYISKSCVRTADFDRDGDLDLFIAGRGEPWNYPKAVSSFIYRNDSKGSNIKFTDVTINIAPSLINLGLSCDAVWTDFDNDNWPDLVIAGEWMPLKFLKNNEGKFSDVTETTGVSNYLGWWRSILPADFDNDGNMDYVVGNLGLNSFYRASEQNPVSIYAKDFNTDGSYDAFVTVYLPASQKDKTKNEYPAHLRDDVVKQIIGLRSKFQNYKTYAAATFDKLFTKEDLTDALKLRANYFAHSFLHNLGNGKFELVALPSIAQYSCINGMVAEDFDQDGNIDIAMVGNDYGTEVNTGRYDGCNGIVVKGNGQGKFFPLSIMQSGWFVPGNAKATVKLKGSSGNLLLAASQNRGPLKIFELNKNVSFLALNYDDVSAVIIYRNGQKQKREFYGASFLSESGRFITINDNIISVEIMNMTGKKRLLKF